MQAFRNAAKPLMVVVAFTFFAWLVVDLSGISGSTGLLTKTAVGKVNGRSIDARVYQTAVQQNIDARQRQAPGALGLEDYEQIRNDVWEQFVQSSVLDAEYRRRGITVNQDEINRALGEEARRHRGYEKQVVEFYRNNPEALANLRAPIFEDKVVDFITEMATVVDKTVSIEDLLKPETDESSTASAAASAT